MEEGRLGQGRQMSPPRLPLSLSLHGITEHPLYPSLLLGNHCEVTALWELPSSRGREADASPGEGGEYSRSHRALGPVAEEIQVHYRETDRNGPDVCPPSSL